MKEDTPTPQTQSRRRFLTTTGTAALGLYSAPNLLAQTGNSTEKIRLGVIGAGHRGQHIAKIAVATGGYEITAIMDYFPEKAKAFGDEFGIPAENQYSGLRGYLKVLEQKNVDAVAIMSPPYFHPEQTERTVEAGKHVYLSKPVAVDVPGCYRIQKAGEAARRKGLVFLVDFQTRANEFFQEAIRRVHAGALGEFAYGQSFYETDSVPWTEPTNTRDPEHYLHHWGAYIALSGDIVVEQNIHTLDVCDWIMQKPPLTAIGTGGQKVRLYGNCWDHYSLLLDYGNGVGVTFNSRQYNSQGSRPEGIRNRMYGSKGTLETEYGGNVLIRAEGDGFYRGGNTGRIYHEGAETNVIDFRRAVLAKDTRNATLEPSVQSNLLSILCRTAGHNEELVRWEQILQSKEAYEPDLKGLRL